MTVFKQKLRNILKFHCIFLIIFIACSTWQGYKRACSTESFPPMLHKHTCKYQFFKNYEIHRSCWSFKNTKTVFGHNYLAILIILVTAKMKQTSIISADRTMSVILGEFSHSYFKNHFLSPKLEKLNTLWSFSMVERARNCFLLLLAISPEIKKEVPEQNLLP